MTFDPRLVSHVLETVFSSLFAIVPSPTESQVAVYACLNIIHCLKFECESTCVWNMVAILQFWLSTVLLQGRFKIIT